MKAVSYQLASRSKSVYGQIKKQNTPITILQHFSFINSLAIILCLVIVKDPNTQLNNIIDIHVKLLEVHAARDQKVIFSFEIILNKKYHHHQIGIKSNTKAPPD